ncbi:MAG TPA: ImmA/IrrE family metallo-endopeptidase [Gemmataceae bacterium]|nr:ImmA/IrrE family metallo-endopeptidase [Gemmataceae bacterium]
MSVPVWCADFAAGFWAAASDPPPFPRDLTEAISGALPLCVIELPGLQVAAVHRWFADRGIGIPLDEPDRPLRGCLVAWLGHGFAFVEATDDPAERRFSLAHELAHFLRDYWRPRETAVARLGPTVRDVLDGYRMATPEERLHALLRNAPVGPFAHLLRRDESGRPLSFAERQSESAADRLAFELLAPAVAIGEIRERARIQPMSKGLDTDSLPPSRASSIGHRSPIG